MTKFYWWCPECKIEVDPSNVTFQELHDACGTAVETKEITEGETPALERATKETAAALDAVRYLLVELKDCARFYEPEIFKKPELEVYRHLKSVNLQERIDWFWSPETLAAAKLNGQTELQFEAVPDHRWCGICDGCDGCEVPRLDCPGEKEGLE